MYLGLRRLEEVAMPIFFTAAKNLTLATSTGVSYFTENDCYHLTADVRGILEASEEFKGAESRAIEEVNQNAH